MRKISGMGAVRTEQYGQAFLDIILDYCQEKGLASLIHTKSEKRDRLVKKKNAVQKGDSHRTSFELFRKGHSFKEIAEIRKLAQSTVEGHLTRFVASGDIDISSLVSAAKMSLIEEAIHKTDGYAITPIKQVLGDAVSFAEIHWVLAAKGLEKAGSSDQ